MTHDLSIVQVLEFELGSQCNLGKVHTACPNRHPDRYVELDTGRELDDETIVSVAIQAYRDLGFTGLVGWIYYNEPLLQADRMFSLMEHIKQEAPQARFILWTNGMLIPEECEQYRAFSQIVISGYNDQSHRGYMRLWSREIDATYAYDCELDGRLHSLTPKNPTARCLRPFVEFIIDNHGNTHLCCYDWRGRGTCGNVFHVPFADIARTWHGILPSIVGEHMTDDAPVVCRGCGHRDSRGYQTHDIHIVNRARIYRSHLQTATSVSSGTLLAARMS